MQGTPKNMQQNPHYNNIFEEIFTFFSVKLKQLKDLGYSSTTILDPGFGFGKTVEHNYFLLNSLKKFKELNCPILVGVSRKSMINKVLNTTPAEALNGTSVLNTISLLNGADILRVHDVAQAREAVELVGFYNKCQNL
jgi:dihydropteroate synthase